MDPRARSNATLEQRVAALEAIEDVRRLLQRYTWALDHADFESIVDCFCDDGVFAFQDAAWGGRAAIRSYFEEDRKTHTEMLHYPVNVVVDVVDLDPARGEGVALADATLWDLFNLVGPGSTEGACLAGYYHVRALRRQGEWRIERLEVTARWVAAVPAWELGRDFHARPEQRPTGA